ncbi:GreA/GreB family elongation factor [Patescibacteria group bacterium]|nr:GreA/GreB family elongation factor [Patescibacteria group bacterium]HPD08136.1 GreA/GreB family elongation factor [bacterium]HRT11376.1 GreA/GreB family elongation factor [Patescibacteria group bacterium]HRU90115.1 GreA/GreB family elongation factor [Patescibacteria group bacterium]
MRLPVRKGGKYTFIKPDPYLTSAKAAELKKRLEWLKKVAQPRAIKEVSRLAEMGDFSENAAYQMAKGRLRGINQEIIELHDYLNQVVIIEPPRDNRVGLGSRVEVEMDGENKSFLILGSKETNPSKGIISHNSPLGAALLGRQAGEEVNLKLANRWLKIRIIKVN